MAEGGRAGRRRRTPRESARPGPDVSRETYTSCVECYSWVAGVDQIRTTSWTSSAPEVTDGRTTGTAPRRRRGAELPSPSGGDTAEASRHLFFPPRPESAIGRTRATTATRYRRPPRLPPATRSA